MTDRLSHSQEAWARGGAYEPYVGRWSRLAASEFLNWLAMPTGSYWLDVGCGTGALTQTILQSAAPRKVNAIDRSDDYIAFAREHIPDARVQFQVADAQALPVASGVYDAVVSALALNFVPQPELAVAEMTRVARPRGVVAVYVWDYAGKMQFIRHFWNAVSALDPTASNLDEGRRFPICQPGPLKRLFQESGLAEIQVRPIDISTDFQNFEDYWAPFLGGQGPAPGYTMSLSEERRAVLRERIRAGLPFALDGSIPLVARAWAVLGVRQ